MRKLYTPIAVVLLLLAGAVSADPAQPVWSAGAPQAAAPAGAPVQTYTSTDGRFSVLFPGTPKLEAQPIHLKNGETTTLYEFEFSADDDKASYIVMYNDYAADVIAGAPDALLQRTEAGAVVGKTLLTETAIDLHGVPGRAYTAKDSDGYNYDVHEFLSGTRFYQLIITTAKGDSATHRDLFMNSFSIL